MADIFDSPQNSFRPPLDTELDADSPLTETSLDNLRVLAEALIQHLAGVYYTGSLTADPTDDTTGDAEDTVGSFSDDEHNGRLLIFTTGNAKGNTYTIDDTVAADDTAYCTGDNLYSDGARSGDEFIITGNFLAAITGHTHDDVDSPNVLLADASVVNAKLKTATGSSSGSLGAGNNVVINMQAYCFFPNIYGEGTTDMQVQAQNSTSSDQVGRLRLYNSSGSSGRAYSVDYRYIQASDKPFIYAIRDPGTGQILHLWMDENPPPGLWHIDPNDVPEDFERPIVVGGKKPAAADEIILFRQPLDIKREIEAKARVDKKFTYEVFGGDWEYDDKAKMLKKKNLSMI
jgi:hypothetical protein